jgi:hypothetical protein
MIIGVDFRPSDQYIASGDSRLTDPARYEIRVFRRDAEWERGQSGCEELTASLPIGKALNSYSKIISDAFESRPTWKPHQYFSSFPPGVLRPGSMPRCFRTTAPV